MFSLIVTIVSIALVALLAAATLYFGGAQLAEGQSNARAAQVLNAGQQVLAALEMHRLQHGRYPDSLNDLITDKHLNSLPDIALSDFTLISAAHAAPETISGWRYDAPRPHLAYVGTLLDTPVCASVNKQVNGAPMVLSVLDLGLRTQCVHSAIGLSVVFRNAGASAGSWPQFVDDLMGGDPARYRPDVFAPTVELIQSEGYDIGSGLCVIGCTPAELAGSSPTNGTGDGAPPGGTEPGDTDPPVADAGQGCFANPASCEEEGPVSGKLVFSGGTCKLSDYVGVNDQLELLLSVPLPLPSMDPNNGRYYLNDWTAAYGEMSADNCAHTHYGQLYNNTHYETMDCGYRNDWSVFPFFEYGRVIYDWSTQYGLLFSTATLPVPTLDMPLDRASAVRMRKTTSDGEVLFDLAAYCDLGSGRVMIKPYSNIGVRTGATGIGYFD